MRYSIFSRWSEIQRNRPVKLERTPIPHCGAFEINISTWLTDNVIYVDKRSFLSVKNEYKNVCRICKWISLKLYEIILHIPKAMVLHKNISISSSYQVATSDFLYERINHPSIEAIHSKTLIYKWVTESFH